MSISGESRDGPTRERGLAQKYGSDTGQITTLMFRNVPTLYTQDMLLEEIIDCMGSCDGFDFFYLPWDIENDCNVGYAFINFRDAGNAERCARLFTNFHFRHTKSIKACKVYPSHIQGLENNLLHLMDRVVSQAHSHYPIIMWRGEKLKLGKVIAALDSQNKLQAPMSAPGRMTARRGPIRNGGGQGAEAPTWPPRNPPGLEDPNATGNNNFGKEMEVLEAMPALRAVCELRNSLWEKNVNKEGTLAQPDSNTGSNPRKLQSPMSTPGGLGGHYRAKDWPGPAQSFATSSSKFDGLFPTSSSDSAAVAGCQGDARSANVTARSACPPSMQNMMRPLEAAPLAPLPEETTTVEGEDRTNLVDVRNPDEEVLMKFFQKFNT